ncbi:MAG: 2'-5' RNA ligase family protein [Bacteroidota bacterium]|nr:2'-5' RNA ligase family protein [Bacteroidota bacterium]
MYMYFIALVLPDELNKKILPLKQMMLEKWGCKVGLKSPAHITIIPPFWMEQEKEQQLLKDMDSISHKMMPFSITTNNFSAFKPRTIFIDVEPNNQLNQIKKETDNFFRNNEAYKIKTENRPFHPHITIATRDLYKKAFGEAWMIFGVKEFKETWKAEGLSLLRHNKRNWDVIYTSGFAL